LIKLTGRDRDIDYRETKNKETGGISKKVKREGPKSSRKLELEMDWLQKYVTHELKGKKKKKQQVGGKNANRAGGGQSPQKKKVKLNESGKKAIVSSSLSLCVLIAHALNRCRHPQGNSTKSKSNNNNNNKGKGKAPAAAYCPDDDGDDEIEWGQGWGREGGALETANKYSSRKKGYSQKTPRYQVYHDGKKVERGDREGTVAFSGKGRTLG